VKPATCFRSFGGQVVASDDDEVLSAVLNAGCCLGRGCSNATKGGLLRLLDARAVRSYDSPPALTTTCITG
jgi:hypothetical protein